MKNFKIGNVEIESVNDGNALLSCISVSVEIIINNETFCIEYQTTENCDYGFVNSNIELYRDDGYANGSEALINALGFDDYEDSFDFFEELKEKNNWQKLFDDYVKENYIQEDNDNSYDANSEINEITLRA